MNLQAPHGRGRTLFLNDGELPLPRPPTFYTIPTVIPMMESPKVKAQLQEKKDKDKVDKLADKIQEKLDSHPAVEATAYTDVSYNREKEDLYPTVFVDIASPIPTYRIEQVEDMVKNVLTVESSIHAKIYSDWTGNKMTANTPIKM